jgi:Leucine-rich repeat (LRR) protein
MSLSVVLSLYVLFLLAQLSNSLPVTVHLYEFYSALDGVNWDFSGGGEWNFTSFDNDPCLQSWFGIECDAFGISVETINLSEVGLSGSLPPSIGNFTDLKHLYLASNSISGSLPGALFQLSNLEELDLSFNSFTGTLSPDFQLLPSLALLNLKSNAFVGSIPEEFCELSQLYLLRISVNGFTGQLPKAIGKLSSLSFLSISFNQFTGPFPSSIRNLTLLDTFFLGENLFSGTFPKEIGNLVSLYDFEPLKNLFHGSLPEEMGNLQQLNYFDASMNSFSGSFPNFVKNLPNLMYLYLQANQFTGEFSFDGFSPSTSLIEMNLGFNQIHGNISESVVNLANLEYLDLSYNYFNGSLPVELSQLSSLAALYLAGNHFTGTIPVEYNQLTGITDLILSLNAFTGPFPLTDLSNLAYFVISNNQFTGAILANGSFFDHFPLLVFLNVEFNRFSGTISSKVGQESNLLLLGLTSNIFSGTIPSILSDMTAIEYIGFANNHFTGVFPTMQYNTKSLADLLIFNNRFEGNVCSHLFNSSVVLNGFKILDLSRNQFSGSINCFKEVMPNAEMISVGSNYLVGNVEKVFESMTANLKILSLAKNKFQGNLNSLLNVSSDINGFKKLMTLDLSGNQFSGSLSAKFFERANESLRVLSLGVNCIEINIPSTICQAKTLQFVILDGMGVDESCQIKYFPKTSLISSYKLPSSSNNQIPPCLFGLPELKILHLSGNGFTGSLPSNITISSTLQDLSLSYNLLSGSIPAAFQNHSWNNLDLKYNKFNGVLTSDFYNFPSNETTLSLSINRLSGIIPSQLLSAQQISILEGNMFNCHVDTATQEQILPHSDPYLQSFICGSRNVNNSLISWVSLASGLIALLVFGIVYRRHLQKKRNNYQIHPEGEDIVDDDLENDNEDTEKKKEIIDIPEKEERKNSFSRCCSVFQDYFFNRLKLYYKWWNKISSISALVHHKHKKDMNDEDEHDLMMVLSQKIRYSGLIHFSRTMNFLQRFVVVSTFLILVFFIPLNLYNSRHYSTHTESYIWVTSMAYYANRKAAYSCFVIIFVFFLICFSTIQLEKWKEKKTKEEAENATRRHASSTRKESMTTIAVVNSIIKPQPQPPKSSILWTIYLLEYSLYLIAVLLNGTVILGINLGYIYFINTNLTKTQATLLQIAVAVLKSIWSLFFIKRFLLKILIKMKEYKSQKLNAAGETVGSTNKNAVVLTEIWQRNSEIVVFSSLLNIFNSILAPYLAAMIFDPNCFKFLIFQAPKVSSSYELDLGNVIQILGFWEGVSFENMLSYIPPFNYNFQCSSTLLSEFITIFIFKFCMVIGIFLFTFVLEEIVSFLESVTHYFSTTDTGKEGSSSFLFLNKLMAKLPLIPKEVKFLLLKNANSATAHHQNLLSDGKLKNDFHSWLFFECDVFVISILADLATLFTFGIVFPLLAFIICISLIFQILFHNLLIGRLVCEFEEEMEVEKKLEAENGEKDSDCSSDEDEDESNHDKEEEAENEKKKSNKEGVVTDEDVERNKIDNGKQKEKEKTHTIQYLIRLNKECELLSIYLFANLDYLHIIGCLFLSFFLFDILGDDLGINQSMWILPVVGGCFPISISFGYKLFQLYSNGKLKNWSSASSLLLRSNQIRSNQIRSNPVLPTDNLEGEEENL